MGIGVFGTGSSHNSCHLRGGFFEDPELSSLDSRQDNSGMTALSAGQITTQSPPSQHAPSLRVQTLE